MREAQLNLRIIRGVNQDVDCPVTTNMRRSSRRKLGADREYLQVRVGRGQAAGAVTVRWKCVNASALTG